MSALFVALTATGRTHGAWGYLQTAAEASMVGGAADWFAVTALFRRPLGLPIPHTAVIVTRKDQFGETLGRFVQEQFLNGDVVSARLRQVRLAPRLAGWLAARPNAEALGGQIAGLLRDGSVVLRGEDFQRVVGSELRESLDRASLAALAGRSLGVLAAPDRRDALLDGLIGLASRLLEENHEALRRRFRTESPRWVPPAVDDVLFDRIVRRVRRELAAVAGDPTHPQRLAFHRWVDRLEHDLQTDSPAADRLADLQRQLLDDEAARRWSGALWDQIVGTLDRDADDPGSRLRLRLSDAVQAAGRRLGSDPELAATVEAAAEAAVRSAAENFRPELSELVSGTIARWDAGDTAARLELLLGPDLQYIRLNGTLVGALVGLGLHGLAALLA